MKSLDYGTFNRLEKYVSQTCMQLNVDGVFAIAHYYRRNDIWWGLINRDRPLDDASDGRKYNLLAIALDKLAAVLSHGEPSGEVKYEGESPYRGGILSNDFAYAFSGGTEDQDIEIVRMVAEYHKTL